MFRYVPEKCVVVLLKKDCCKIQSRYSLTSLTFIICTRRMDSRVCCWERSLSWCRYPIHQIWRILINFVPLVLICPVNKILFLLCLLLLLISSLCSQLLFVVGFTVFLANCVDYDILFANKFVNHTDSSKVTLPDAFLPVDVCSARWVSSIQADVLLLCGMYMITWDCYPSLIISDIWYKTPRIGSLSTLSMQFLYKSFQVKSLLLFMKLKY